MLNHKMDFNCCANSNGFRKSSHILSHSKAVLLAMLKLTTLYIAQIVIFKNEVKSKQSTPGVKMKQPRTS